VSGLKEGAVGEVGEKPLQKKLSHKKMKPSASLEEEKVVCL
jgi:hypothetical protein